MLKYSLYLDRETRLEHEWNMCQGPAISWAFEDLPNFVQSLVIIEKPRPPTLTVVELNEDGNPQVVEQQSRDGALCLQIRWPPTCRYRTIALERASREFWCTGGYDLRTFHSKVCPCWAEPTRPTVHDRTRGEDPNGWCWRSRAYGF